MAVPSWLDDKEIIIETPRTTLKSLLPRVLIQEEKLMNTVLKFNNIKMQTTPNLAHHRMKGLDIHHLSPNEVSDMAKIVLCHAKCEIVFCHFDGAFLKTTKQEWLEFSIRE